MKKLIIIEGLDGSGKSTQIDLLCKHFEKEGKPYRKIKFPDYSSPSSSLVKMYLGGEFGKNAADVNPYAASSFYAVDRYASFKLKWKEDYESGKIILSDRYVTSNLIYQTEKLKKEDRKAFIEWDEDFEYGKMGIPRPDLVIYLDMPVEISQGLMTSRYGGDESKKDVHEADAAFLSRCRECALFAAKEGNWRVVECCGGKNPLPPLEIHKKIIEILEKEISDA